MSIEYQPAPKTHGDIWAALRLPSRGTKLHEVVHQGLPFELLDQIATLVQMPRADLSRAICGSSTTLARRTKTGRFNTAESDRLVTLIAVFDQACYLFENDAAAAKKWMITPLRGLGSRRPLDLRGTRAESSAVFDLVGQLEMGVLV